MENFLERLLQTPRAKVSDREWSAVRYRWEFLRLNPSYKKNYKRHKRNILPQYHHKWGIGEWVDPDLSFDDLYKQIRKTVSKEDDAKWLTIMKLRPPSKPATLYHSHLDTEGNPIRNSGINLRIDLNYSDAEILEEVKKLLLVFRDKQNKIRQPWNWKTLPKCLKAATLYFKQGKSPREISEILFPPPNPYSEDESTPDVADDSSARETRRYLRIGKKLVKGGYKEIA